MYELFLIRLIYNLFQIIYFIRILLQTKVLEVTIAMNPCESFEDLYTEEVMSKYKKANEEDLPPHIFSIGNIDSKVKFNHL